ncbi:MAG: hypothetical protein FWE40_01620 [Oscillospiraceae bacterium]|nr:hypothetical protein [Oscillospiraceae bacterium]
MLYPENRKPVIDLATFQNPGSEYRATPFWCWNCKLDQAVLNRQIDAMEQMGFGGFHMHVRVGLATEYLGDVFMQHVKDCTAYAKHKRMLAWLYDEDKWPSGFAGGLVTQDPQHRQKTMLFTPKQRDDLLLLASYAIEQDEQGNLLSYTRSTNHYPLTTIHYYAYLQVHEPTAWYNGQTYVDGLSKAAIERFVEVTHERYREAVGEEFGKTVPAIFSDEPECGRKKNMQDPLAGESTTLPWTTDFAETYQAEYGEDLLDFVPELFFNLAGGKISRARYRYHDHCSERFASAFADTMGDWCEKHGLLLTGHMMAEQDLRDQTKHAGDCMRSYRAFQLPGIDLLCDNREFNTAKQAQSAARQYARPGVMSELYGVTNWNFPFYKHKLQSDWQAALGISVRVPHLYWVSMRGEAKRDYPASIGHQSPWYKQYKHMESHFARVNSAMTRGTPKVRVGVIHPVESFWLHWGPDSQCRAVQDEMDHRFAQLTDWLLFAHQDFDFICESLLPSQHSPSAEQFNVGAMNYDVVIAPQLQTIRGTTLKALQDFEARGGHVIWLGGVPTHVDAQLAPVSATAVSWSKTALLGELAPYQMHTVLENAVTAKNIITQRRRDGEHEWLFLCHAHTSPNYYTNRPRMLQVQLTGVYSAEQFNTLTGKVTPLPCCYVNGNTVIDWTAHGQDSLLLRLTVGVHANPPAVEEPCLNYHSDLPPLLPITLEEPNVLLLDMPEHSLNGGAWQPAEEVLRVCDKCKAILGLENEVARGMQPYCLLDEPAQHQLKLRYTVQSQLDVEQVQLAVEDLDTLQITWNGHAVDTTPTGHYVDESIQTVALGKLHAGENILEITLPFGKATTVESCFILGDFGVRVRGRLAEITPPVRELAWGDWTAQGLPFYGGNVVYHAQVELPAGNYALEATHFAQPVLAVTANEHDCGIIAISPWRTELGELAGNAQINVTACGNRINTFGALHNCEVERTWHGPGAWRVQGAAWTNEYRLTPSGVLVAPRLLFLQKSNTKKPSRLRQ